MSDPAYKTFSYRMLNKGLVAKFGRDVCPEATYMNLENMEAREEGVLSSRYGSSAIIPSADALLGAIHSLGRLKSLTNTYRYAGMSSSLFRRTGDSAGAYTSIFTGLSGSQWSALEYRPDRSSFPYLFIADNNKMLKDDGTFVTAQKWGILAPAIPAQLELQPTAVTLINNFSDLAFAFVNVGALATANRVNTTINDAITGGGAVQAVTPASMAGITTGVDLLIAGVDTVYVISTTTTTFTAAFPNAYAAGQTCTDSNLTCSVAASTTASLSKAGAVNLSTVNGVTATDEDVINLWVNVSNPACVQEIRLLFDVGDGSFTGDYYLKSISAASFQSLLGPDTGSAAVTRRVFDRAGGRSDARRRGSQVVDLLDIDDSLPEQLRPSDLLTGLNRWTRIEVKRKEFVRVGLADSPGHDWSNVSAFQISVQTNSTGGITLQLDDLYLYGGNGPDVFASVNYDYRYTYYNINTGAESAPSIVLIDSSWVSPRRQPVKVTWLAPTDPQVTHVRLYRRGGTLPSDWLKIAEVPIGTNTYIDGLADFVIAENTALQLDNGPPVESTLKVPIDTVLLNTPVQVGTAPLLVDPAIWAQLSIGQYLTIDSGALQETVIIYDLPASGIIFAWVQYRHSAGARILANTRFLPGLRLAALAFDRVWLAGDSDNPNRLYYSKKYRPESFPPQNYIDVGTPSEPLRAVVEFNGAMFVFTSSCVYRIFGVGSPVPIPIKVAATYGILADFAWVQVEDSVWYLSGNGVYVFRGGPSEYMSFPIEWLFNNQTDGPVAPLGLPATSRMAYDRQRKAVYLSGEFGPAANPVPFLSGSTSATLIMAPVFVQGFTIGQTVRAYDVNGVYLGSGVIINTSPTSLFIDGGLQGRIAGHVTNAGGTVTNVLRKRLCYDLTQKRWRNDSVAATAMLCEQDTLNFIFGNESGRIFKDRVGDADFVNADGSGATAFTFTLETPALDNGLPKNWKVYNELTIDANTRGQNVAVSLIFDDGTSAPLSLGNLNTASRDQQTFNINAGIGRLSRNVTLRLSGSVTQEVDINEIHIRAAVEAELRKSFDSYWVKYGSDEFKVIKQGWYEYVAGSPITFSCYVDGSATAEFTFTLPVSATRQTKRVRFPAIKAKTFRWVATSATDFQLYDDSQVEVKPARARTRWGETMGYAKTKLST